MTDELNVMIEEEQTLNVKLENDSINTGTSNYEELSNKPKINNVELSGNKSLSDLGIDIPTVPTNVSAFTNDAGYLTEHQDISGKEDKTNKVTSISSQSTDTEYPSALAVYTLFNSITDADNISY